VTKRSAKAPTSSADTVGLRYIESSALAAALLERDLDALKSVRTRGRKVTSALTIAEVARAILRARATARLTAEQERAAVQALRRFERRCYLVAVTDAVLARARRAFPVEPVRTLDALHLASALVFAGALGPIRILSLDDKVRENGAALGFALAP